MIVPDVNLLVYAYNEDAFLHDRAKAWWGASLSGTEPVGLAWSVMLGFARVVANRRILAAPIGVERALYHCRSWLAQPQVQVLIPGPSHLDILADLLRGPTAVSALVPDAHLAALAIEHQAELYSNDSDFGRFSGLRWRNPVR